MVRQGDSHKLFIGNLPHEVDNSELMKFFQNYGKVVELHINSVGKLPNFSFVAHHVLRCSCLDVEEKTHVAKEGGLRNNGLRGPRGLVVDRTERWTRRPSPRRYDAETRVWHGQEDCNSKAAPNLEKNILLDKKPCATTEFQLLRHFSIFLPLPLPTAPFWLGMSYPPIARISQP
ncbi:hypothetical protein A6R68_00761 [Neotoma lepida]|uniref:RRM domain-containing protein n=1 Tax=Neotoma lepida TaxID=56216 RepID=A0A1A6GWI8_NEOLE|nr:hypothetical protein A6R68_00761 [Neotoma lepida]